jgi:hypothetical protein
VKDERDLERFFPESLIQRLNEAHEARARLLHAESVLGDWGRAREWFRDEDGDEPDAYKHLKAQRAELLDRTHELESTKERGGDGDRVEHQGPLVGVSRRSIANWGHNIGIDYPLGCPASEGSVLVPVFLEGTSVTPGGSASGAIATLPTTSSWEAPEPHYWGVLRAPLKFPFFDLSYWLHNWRFVIPFPCAACDSRLTYRVYFETGGAFGASAVSAALMNWINVREIPDVSAGIDFGSLPDYEVWPLDRRWPFMASFMFESVWGGVTLEGSFTVTRGKSAVIAVLVGAIVGLTGGQFRIFNAGFHPWEMQLFPPGGFPQPPDFQFHAKVHYRYEPTGGVFHP